MHDQTGTQNVFHFPWGSKSLNGFSKATMFFTCNPLLARYIPTILKPFLSSRLPVYRDATLALQYMQPVIVSHGMTAHKMHHSSICMELASCGYCVFVLTHEDGSADYAPGVGDFDVTHQLFDLWQRHLNVKVRADEVQQLSREILVPDGLRFFGQNWAHTKLSQNLVLIGHSFGGTTMLKAAKLIPEAKAIISLDPFMFPLSNDKPVLLPH